MYLEKLTLCLSRLVAVTWKLPLVPDTSVPDIHLYEKVLDADVHAAQSAPKSETAADVTNWTSE